MLKVYDIEDGYNYSQTHSVVAESMADAERIYKKRYNNPIIKNIRLHSEYILVQGIDDKAQPK